MQAFEDWAAPRHVIEDVWRLPFHKAVVSRSLWEKGRSLDVPASHLHLVPNGLDTTVFRTTRPVTDRPPHLAFLAHEAPVKGLSEALEVVRRVRHALPSVPVTAFGSVPRPRSLPDDIEYVHGHTGRALVEAVYDRASVFLVSSRSEGWGYPALEAMACGAALVSTRNGGVDDFAEDGVTGVLRPVGDLDGLAAACLTLLTDDDRRVPLAEAGIVRAATFGWDRAHAAFRAALNAAVADGVPAGRTPRLGG